MTKIIITASSTLYFDQRVQRIAQTLRENDYDVCIVGRHNNKSIKDDRIHGFPVKWISCFFKSSFLFYAELNIRLFFLLMFSKASIIYACDLDTILPAVVLRKVKCFKIIFDAHEYFEEVPELEGKKFIKRIWELICKFALPKTTLRFTVSHSLALELFRKYHHPFIVLRNLPEISSEKLTPIFDKQKIIWYQGVLNKGRGLEQMIEAMQHLDEYKLYLAGDGDIERELKNLSNNLNLENRVFFLGKLEPMTLRSQNRVARIGVNLLEASSLNYYYSLANKTFDYIEAGLPSIHMDFPEYKLLCEKYNIGKCIKNLSPAEIVSAIKFYESEEQYNLAVNACLIARQELVWNMEKNVLVKALEENNLLESKKNKI